MSLEIFQQFSIHTYLLLNPIPGLINVPVESLHLMRTVELLLSLLGLLFQSTPSLIEILNLLTNSDGSFGLADRS